MSASNAASGSGEDSIPPRDREVAVGYFLDLLPVEHRELAEGALRMRGAILCGLVEAALWGGYLAGLAAGIRRQMAQR